MAEINDAPVTPVSSAGFLVAVTADPESPAFQKVAAAELADVAAKATSAIQAADLGTAAYADADSFITPEAHQAAIDGLQAQIDLLLARFNNEPGNLGVLPATLPFTLSSE